SGSVAAAQGRGSPAAWRLPRIAGARAVSRLPGIAGARQHSGCPESRGPGSVRGGWPPTRAGSEAQPWPRRSGQNGANYGWPVSVAALGAAPTVVTGDSQVRRTWFYCAFCFTDYLPSEHDQQMGLVTASRTAGCTCIGNRSSSYIWACSGARGASGVISAGQVLRSAPGRSRTDTGDPFRGPASSLGLRGLGNNTPAARNQLLANRIGLDCFPWGLHIQFRSVP